MAKRKSFFKLVPKATDIMIQMESYIKETSIEPILYELIKTRVSQINGCAHCLQMHTKDAIKYGETHERLHLLAAWRDVSLFTEKEKLALELAERLTEVTLYQIDDELYEALLKHFTEKEFADLVIIINQINSWNRLNIANNTEV